MLVWAQSNLQEILLQSLICVCVLYRIRMSISVCIRRFLYSLELLCSVNIAMYNNFNYSIGPSVVYIRNFGYDSITLLLLLLAIHTMFIITIMVVPLYL